MPTSSRNHKFGSTVQLGLFTIVVVLLFLNVSANYIIYQVWKMHKMQISLTMNQLAVEISRKVQALDEPVLGEALTSQLKQSFNLTGLTILPSVPETDDPSIRWRWYLTGSRHLDVNELNRITPAVLHATATELIAGEDDLYSLTYLFPADQGQSLLVIYKPFPTLRYLDITSRRMFVFNLAALALIIILSLMLRRYIMAPFKKMRLAAEQAGRSQSADADEVDIVVDEYRKMIDELQEKEARLVKMNRIISSRADRLEQFNAHILSSMSSGLISINRDGVVNSLNRAAASILATDEASLLGKSIISDVCQDNTILRVIRSAYQSRQSRDYYETELLNANGELRRIGITISLITDEDDKFLGVTTMIVDTTELHHLRKSLETKERLSALGEMAGGLAHQLRNTLGAILGYGRLVKKRLVANKLSTDCVEAIEQEGTEAENMIEKFLSFSKPFEFQPTRENLMDLLKKSSNTDKVRANLGHIEISLHVPNDLSIMCDRLLLKQAICNIVDNAVGAYDKLSGLIRIESYPDGETIQITIEDYAGGIPEKIQSQIFTPFVSSRPGGTGLGLSLAARIVDLHGGSLQLLKSSPEGTTFQLSLPNRIDKIKTKRPEPVAIKY